MNKFIEFVSVIALLFIVGAGAYSFFNLGLFNDHSAAVQVFDGLGWFVGLFGIATVFTSYLVVIADTKFIFRFLAIPAWLAFSFALLAALDQFIGYPYPGVPPKAQVLQYRVISNSDNTKTIEAWMYLLNDHQTRAYSFPHSPNREEALHEAMQAKARGEMVLINMEPTDRAGTDDPPTPEDMIERHDIRHQGLPLKGGEEPNVQSGSPQQEIDNSDKILLRLPGGTIIEIKPGNSFTITDEGEIEIFNDKRVKPFSSTGSGRTGGRHSNEVEDFIPDTSDFEGNVDPR